MSIIRETRKSLGLSQVELAEQLGVSQGSVSSWENLEYKPNTATLLAVSQKLGIPLDVLLSDYTRSNGHDA